MANRASSEAITMSQAAAYPAPPPKQAFCTNAMVGLLHSSSALMAAVLNLDAASLTLGSAVASSLNQFTSAPAEKCLPAPLRRTARIEGSESNSPKMSRKEVSNASLYPLKTSGRLSVTVATPRRPSPSIRFCLSSELSCPLVYSLNRYCSCFPAADT